RTFPGAEPASVVGACAGLITVVRGWSLGGAMVTVALTWLCTLALPGSLKRPRLVVPALVFSLTLVVKTGLAAVGEPSTYQYIAILFEALFAALLTVVFLIALPSVHKLNGLSTLTGEEIFALLALLAVVVGGTGDLQVSLVSLKGVLSRLIILVAALLGGVGLGAAVGAVVGVIPGLVYTTVPILVGAHSFAGLVAGLCRTFGRPGVSIGFLMGNIILSVYLNNFGHPGAVLAETGLAVLLFMLIPGSCIGLLNRSLGRVVFNTGEDAPRTTGRERSVVAGHMRHWSRVFEELSRSFGHAAAVEPGQREDPALQSMFNEIAGKVCQGCGLYRTCWERDFYRTYQDILDLFTLVESYGQVTAADLPDALKRRCSRPKELAITVTCMYEAYKLNQYWMKRMAESREIVSEQLKGVAEMIENLSAELESTAEAPAGAEQLLRQKLKSAGVPVMDVRLSRSGDGRQEILLARHSCEMNPECPALLSRMVSRVMGEPFAAPFTACPHASPGELCMLRLYGGLQYRLSVGVAAAGKNGSAVSGDSYAFIPLRDGKCALVLSDGMGSGPAAALESGTAVSLLQRLLESGLDRHLAIKTVNSIMILRSPGDSFATLDMTMVDLKEGQAEFVKIGAPPAFLVRGRRVSVIRASSLPVGIIKDIDVASVTRKLAAGDMLVMVSDGILDSCRGPGDREDWVVDVLREVTDFSPRDCAALLLKLAQTGAGGECRIPDDMTVVAARVEKI
ncbi:MAG TPA: stage II sporulation protein E, partial [Desulfotomaculum sp.]|nr:stage II sporulation protein E [Desulfotomaculum sp.]